MHTYIHTHIHIYEWVSVQPIKLFPAWLVLFTIQLIKIKQKCSILNFYRNWIQCSLFYPSILIKFGYSLLKSTGSNDASFCEHIYVGTIFIGYNYFAKIWTNCQVDCSWYKSNFTYVHTVRKEQNIRYNYLNIQYL